MAGEEPPVRHLLAALAHAQHLIEVELGGVRALAKRQVPASLHARIWRLLEDGLLAYERDGGIACCLDCGWSGAGSVLEHDCPAEET